MTDGSGASGAGQRRVLLAEDDAVNGVILRDILVSVGHSVVWARDGIEALSFVQPKAPDVIVLDLMMPKIDGFEVCARLKGDATTQHIPILVITAIADQESRVRAVEVGADDYIVKPVDRIEVITRVRALLRTKSLYDEVQAQLRAVRRLEELRRSLVQFLVHDLQNPLTAVMANIQIAQMDVEKGKPDALGPSLDDAMGSANRMHGLLQSLLDIEKMEEGRFQVRAEPVDVVRLVQDVVGDQRGTATQNGVKLSAESDGPLTVKSDEGLIRRILGNLVANAIRFSPRETTVRLCVSRDGARALLSVGDEGPGVPRALRDRVFEKFHQAGTVRERGGAGLGLTFCKMAAEAMGGEIWVKDDGDGKTGATFVVGLPLR